MTQGMNGFVRGKDTVGDVTKILRTFDFFRRGDNLRSGYAYYCGRCKQEGIMPISFRDWARADQEYDLEWEAVNYDYEQETKTSERERLNMIAEEEISQASDFESDEAMDAKHIRLRGSLALKYPPREASCRHECGLDDYRKSEGKPPVQHRCFLAVGHQGPCEFSSECVA